MRGFSGIECSLYGLVENVTTLKGRLIQMGASHTEQREEQITFGSNADSIVARTSSLIHLMDDGTSRKLISYRAGDYSLEDKTNVINVVEVYVIKGDAEKLLRALDYSSLKVRHYESLTFTRPAGLEWITVKFNQDESSGRWLIKIYGRGKDKSDMTRIENDLLQLATYLDEYYHPFPHLIFSIVKLCPIDRKHFRCKFPSTPLVMLIRKALIGTALRTGHACAGVACKHCIGRTMSGVIRCFATKLARQDNNKEYELSRLSKHIDQEIEFHRRLVKDEELTLERVTGDYAKLIRENDISIESVENDHIKMVIPRENGIKYVIKFDPSQVADSINAAPPNEDDMDDEDNEVVDETAEDEDGEFDEEKMPFNVTLEVHRQGVPKFISMEAEVSPSFENDSSYDVYVTDMFVNKEGTAYTGPSFDTLDNDLRDQFDQLVNKNFRKLMPLVADYAKAREASSYSEWLKDLKEITAGN